MERHRERRLEAAARRRRRVVADRVRRSRLRHVADRHRRAPRRQSSATRAGRPRRPPASARSLRTERPGRRSHVLRRRSIQPHRRPAAVAAPAGSDGPLPGVHDKHNLASPSPVTDGQMVYAWFGTGQIVALDMNGKVVWQRHLGKEIAPFDINWGHASSPTLYRRHLFSCCAITRRRRICSPSTRRPARNAGGWIAARDGCRTRRRSSSRRRPVPS